MLTHPEQALAELVAGAALATTASPQADGHGLTTPEQIDQIAARMAVLPVESRGRVTVDALRAMQAGDAQACALLDVLNRVMGRVAATRSI